MLLDSKSAVIYGGGGSIGGAVARAFGREGARVFLAGRTLATLEEVAEAIRATGGAAETAEVDALDEQAVDRHADAVVAESGGIDISFNLITRARDLDARASVRARRVGRSLPRCMRGSHRPPAALPPTRVRVRRARGGSYPDCGSW